MKGFSFKLVVFGIFFWVFLGVAWAQEKAPLRAKRTVDFRQDFSKIEEALFSKEKPILYPFAHPPKKVRVAVVGATPQTSKVVGYLFSAKWNNLFQKKTNSILEHSVVTVAPQTRGATIYYRPNFMQQALVLAQIFPGEQEIRRMKASNKQHMLGVDIEIYLET